MDRRTRMILGKRGKRNLIPEQTDDGLRGTVPKRSRTALVEDDVSTQQTSPGPPTARLRSGLLTPEPSALTESQVAPPSIMPDGPTQVFPFMKLPAELRIHVYHMALQRDEPVLLHVPRIIERPEEENGPTTITPLRPIPTPYWDLKRTPAKDRIVPEILRLNKLIYKEARQILYDNVFTFSLISGVHTLSTVHQRVRSLIKHVVLTIPSHHDILDGFADLVRLGLRYCWGLKSFKIILQATMPGHSSCPVVPDPDKAPDGDRVLGATSVYANAFHILRWLPRGCQVALEGCHCENVLRIVREEGRLLNVLDEATYLKRQHQMPERY